MGFRKIGILIFWGFFLASNARSQQPEAGYPPAIGRYWAIAEPHLSSIRNLTYNSNPPRLNRGEMGMIYPSFAHNPSRYLIRRPGHSLEGLRNLFTLRNRAHPDVIYVDLGFPLVCPFRLAAHTQNNQSLNLVPVLPPHEDWDSYRPNTISEGRWLEEWRSGCGTYNRTVSSIEVFWQQFTSSTGPRRRTADRGNTLLTRISFSQIFHPIQNGGRTIEFKEEVAFEQDNH